MLVKTWTLATKTTVMLVGIIIVLGVVFCSSTAWMMENEAHGRAMERQDTNLKVAWDILHQYGTTMRVDGDKLYAGQTLLNGSEETVDRLKALVGGTASIFLGDKRVATNVIKPDGARAVGTLLARGPIYDTVLSQGRAYKGEADILGTPYFTAYDPIFDASHAVIGILYVGIPKADFLANVEAVKLKLMITTLVFATAIGLVGVFTTRKMFAPLGGISAGMRALVGGDTSAAMPWASRPDDIGEMAKAVSAFQDAANEKRQIERQAVESRQTAEDERGRNETSRVAASQEQATVVNAIAFGLEKLASGDLMFRLEDPFAPDYESLRRDFNDALSKLQETMTVIAGNTSAIRSGTREISTASDDLARRTEQQAASLEQTAAALDEITATVKKTSDGSLHARQVVAVAKADAEASGDVVKRAADAMAAIERSSQEVGQIVGVIDEIAFQTNLLALNAGVEAARAGDAGRGFAVVASEVRALAQRSAEAAKEIKTLISASGRHVTEGVGLVDLTSQALLRFVTQVTDINVVVSEIAASTKEQATALQEVNIAINQMDQATQQNAAMVEESTAASHALVQETNELARLIGGFRIGAGADVMQRGARPLANAKRASTPIRVLKTVATGGGAARQLDAETGWQEF
jgi:methyl-accepting chemotaxis protein